MPIETKPFIDLLDGTYAANEGFAANSAPVRGYPRFAPIEPQPDYPTVSNPGDTKLPEINRGLLHGLLYEIFSPGKTVTAANSTNHEVGVRYVIRKLRLRTIAEIEEEFATYTSGEKGTSKPAAHKGVIHLIPSKAENMRIAFGSRLPDTIALRLLIPSLRNGDAFQGLRKEQSTLGHSLDVATELGIDTIGDLRSANIARLLLRTTRPQQLRQKPVGSWARSLIFAQYSIKRPDSSSPKAHRT